MLHCRHIFGCRGDVRDGVHALDDATLLYAAGHNVVLLNTENRGQQLIPGSPDSEGILALAVSPNHKYLAVAERGSERGMVTVFDLRTLKRRKVLVSTEAGSKARHPHSRPAQPLQSRTSELAGSCSQTQARQPRATHSSPQQLLIESLRV